MANSSKPINLEKIDKSIGLYTYITYHVASGRQLTSAFNNITENHNNALCNVTVILTDANDYPVDNVWEFRCSMNIIGSPHLNQKPRIVFQKMLFHDENDSRQGARHFICFSKDNANPDIPQLLRMESIGFKSQGDDFGPADIGGFRPNIAAIKIIGRSETHINNVDSRLHNETTTNFYFENCCNVTVENCNLSNNNYGYGNPFAGILDFRGDATDITVRHNIIEKTGLGAAVKFYAFNDINKFRNISVVGNTVRFNAQSETIEKGDSIFECNSHGVIGFERSTICSNIIFSMNDVEINSPVTNVFLFNIKDVTAVGLTGIVFSGNKILHKSEADGEVNDFNIYVNKPSSGALPIVDIRKNVVIPSGHITSGAGHSLLRIEGVAVNLTENTIGPAENESENAIEYPDDIILCSSNTFDASLNAQGNRVKGLKLLLQCASDSNSTFDLTLEKNYFDGFTFSHIASPRTINMTYRNNYLRNKSNVFLSEYTTAVTFNLYINDNVFDSRQSDAVGKLFLFNPHDHSTVDLSAVKNGYIADNVFVSSTTITLLSPGYNQHTFEQNRLIQNRGVNEPLQ